MKVVKKTKETSGTRTRCLAEDLFGHINQPALYQDAGVGRALGGHETIGITNLGIDEFNSHSV
jgi:hypothetical protein